MSAGDTLGFDALEKEITEMASKFFSIIVGTLLFLTPAGLLMGQDSATMSAPVVRTAEGQVVFTTRLQDFVAGNKYRIGIGGVGASAPDAEIELELGETALGKSAADFTQGYTSHWWGMDELKSRGVTLAASDLPGKGKELTFRVKLAREAADNFEKLYIFVSRDYGGNTWYLEDGVELDQSYW
jgi:hypothetical protein